MTRDEISTVSAGRSLDVLIGRLLGWKSQAEIEENIKFESGNTPKAFTPPVEHDGTPWWWSSPTAQAAAMSGVVPCYDRLPRFSTDIAAAWQVLEWMNTRVPERYYCDGQLLPWDNGLPWLEVSAPNSSTKVWAASWSYPEYHEADEFLESAGAPTAPLAICRLALLMELRK